MRFGGLYDCSNLKAHGLGVLIYDNIMTDLVIIYIITEILTRRFDFVVFFTSKTTGKNRFFQSKFQCRTYFLHESVCDKSRKFSLSFSTFQIAIRNVLHHVENNF